MPSTNFRRGNHLPRWGQELQRDVDQLSHWIVDIDRTIDRLVAMRGALENTIQEFVIQSDRQGDMMEWAFKIAGQIVGKTNNLYKTMRTRRLVNGGSFKHSEES